MAGSDTIKIEDLCRNGKGKESQRGLSARLVAPSPPPQLPPRPSPISTAMSNSFSISTKPPISTIEWTQTQLDEYNVHIQETSDMTRLLPAEYTEHESLGITCSIEADA
jgi:hypothetical protein